MMSPRAAEMAYSGGFAKPGERIVITAGVPLGTSGSTNLLRVAFVGGNRVKRLTHNRGVLSLPSLAPCGKWRGQRPSGHHRRLCADPR